MHVKWTKQSQGFNQATYPLKNYNLAANLVAEDTFHSEPVFYLGSVTVEEGADGSLKFLFGSQLAFWSGIDKKLQESPLYPDQLPQIIAELETKIPKPAIV